MNIQFFSAFIISLLHGLIPSHWLPIVALSKKFGWTKSKTVEYATIAALAHALGTILIGFTLYFAFNGVLNFVDANDSEEIHSLPFSLDKLGGGILIFLGFWFYYRHKTHHHFHLEASELSKKGKWVFGTIVLSMFLSPCMEIIGYFLSWPHNANFLTLVWLAVMYVFTTWLSIALGVLLGYKGMKKFDSHKWEHNSGIITSAVMVLSGLSMWFF